MSEQPAQTTSAREAREPLADAADREERALLRLIEERRDEPTYSMEEVMAETSARPG
ncbi:hypothetical protein [Kitasatospora sp. NPDC057500]|uniref:hypothetical protein n=1 Tax=Kitasatospora sp. NPDC057500 TaxID=3346151 RepID=UPI0036869A6F